MADDKAGRSSGWRKAMIGGVAGIMSGGAMMYVSPLVDRVIKPPKPLANFSVEVTGQQLIVHNRSIGDGFVDFGDATELVPLKASTQNLVHNYSKPGTFPIRLLVRNYLGDENERTVPVEIKGAGNGAPAILSLIAVPPCERPIAPATFRFVCSAQNVETCVWDFGEEKPLEISSDSPNQQEKQVTFTRPGRYVIQLAVLNGKQGERKSVPVTVEAAPANALMAQLTVSDFGMKTESITQQVTLAIPQEGTVAPFEKFVSARAGYAVVDAKLDGAPPAGVRNLAILPSADRGRVRVTGETQAAKYSANSGVPVAVIPVTVRMEKTWRHEPEAIRSTLPLAVPGTTTMPLAGQPAGMSQCKRAITLGLFAGQKTPLATLPIPCTGQPINWHGRTYTLKADIVGDQVRVTIQ